MKNQFTKSDDIADEELANTAGGAIVGGVQGALGFYKDGKFCVCLDYGCYNWACKYCGVGIVAHRSVSCDGRTMVGTCRNCRYCDGSSRRAVCSNPPQ